MKKFIIYFGLMLLLLSMVSAEIVIINETEENLYALETVTLTGDLASEQLSIAGSGEVISGKHVKVYLFGPADDLLIESLYVNSKRATVSFDDLGYYFVTEQGKFSLSGTLNIRTIGQIELDVPGPLNALNVEIDHGYAINGPTFYGLYDESIIIQRSEQVSMLVDGAFKYSYAERNTFTYVLDLQAFGDSLSSFTLPLKNGEQVRSVTGALDWSVDGNTLSIELKGTKAVVTVTGLFSAGTLQIPLSEGSHQVLIESDQEKKLTIQTGSQELDVSETRIPPSYPNARVFLSGPYDSFSVTVQDLKLLPSLAASVRSATNQVAITDKGSILGEVRYSYANTGVDYLRVNVDGATPLYAEAGHSPVKLTSEDNELFLSLPKTDYGSFDMVYFTTTDPLRAIDIVEIPLAKTDLPISEAVTTIYLPGDYFVLETFGAKGGSELPTFKSILLFILVIGALGAFVIRSWKFILAYVASAAGLVLFDVRLLLVLIAITLVIVLKRYIEGAKLRWVLAGAGVLVVLGLLMYVGISFFGGLKSSEYTYAGAPTKYRMENAAMVEDGAYDVSEEFEGMQKVGTASADGAITVPTREGVLPVKLELPVLGKSITVTNYLVTKDSPTRLSVLVVASWLKYIIYLIACFALMHAYRMYKSEKDSEGNMKLDKPKDKEKKK